MGKESLFIYVQTPCASRSQEEPLGLSVCECRDYTAVILGSVRAVERALAWQVGTKTMGCVISLASVSLAAGEGLILNVCFSSRIFK